MKRKIIFIIVLFSMTICIFFAFVFFRAPRQTTSAIAETKKGDITFSDFERWLDEKGLPDYTLYDYETAATLLDEMLKDEVLKYGGLKEPAVTSSVSKISDAQILYYYHKNQDIFRRKKQYRLSHIGVGKKGELDVLMSAFGNLLLETKDKRLIMRELADEYTRLDESGRRWGDLGWISEERLPEWFRDGIASLNKEGDHATFSSPYGHHLVMLMHVREEKRFSLEEVEPYITARLKGIYSAKERDGYVRDRLEKYGARLNKDNLKDSLFSRKIMDMCLIDGGQFYTGFDKDEIRDRYAIWEEFVKPYLKYGEAPGWRDSIDKTYRKARVESFYMDKYEVSYGDYMEFLGATGHRPLPIWALDFIPSDNHPVIGVDKNDAAAYCRWRGKRLPTQDEWEFAARGEERRIYPWGDSHPDGKRGNFADKNSEVAWRDLRHDDGHRFSAPVDSYPNGVTPEGVYNLGGNVKEWTERLPLRRDTAIAKGGSYENAFDDMMAGDQRLYDVDKLDRTIGFRCVCDVE